MRALCRLLLGFVLTSTLVSATITLSTSADAKARRVQVARVSAPPAGGEALYIWCRQAVFRKYGMQGIPAVGFKPEEQSHVLTMYMQSSEQMIDYCMQQHGQNY